MKEDTLIASGMQDVPLPRSGGPDEEDPAASGGVALTVDDLTKSAFPSGLGEVGINLYHGTRRALRIGDILSPGDGRNWSQSACVVYVTDDLDRAWMWAESARGRGRPRVAAVEAGSVLEPDGVTLGDYSCSHAFVRKVLMARRA
jgi:hypothetical protein